MVPTPRTVGGAVADIVAARRRSELSGIDPVRGEVRHVGEIRSGAEAIRQLSAPVLDDLMTRVADCSLGAVLADRDGGLTWRDAATATTLAAMDDRGLDVGSSLAEEDVGTNGVGTSLETRLPTLVVGSDHHLENFHGFTCANAPIIHPVTHRLEGTVGVLCPADDTGPLLLPTAVQLATEIGRILLERATPDERFLLEQFVLLRGRARRAVATIGRDVLIATPAAQGMLAGLDHGELWDRVRAIVRHADGGSTDVDIDRPSGQTLHLRCRPLYSGGELSGAAVDVVHDPATRGGRRRARDDRLGDLVGSSEAWRALVREARRAAKLDVPVLVVGERGSGRASVARAMAEMRANDRLTLLDSSRVLVDGAQEWASAAIAALSTEGVVLLRRVGELPDDVAAALARSLADGPLRARVIATTEHSTAATPGRAALMDQLDVVRVVIPPLRERRDDIAPLVSVLSRRYGTRAVDARAVDLLYRYSWPGNVTELCQVLRRAHATAATAAIGASDLPARIRETNSRIPTHGLQQQEADAIITALRSTTSRRAAAEMLGISRATLYRRIAAYGLDAGGS